MSVTLTVGDTAPTLTGYAATYNPATKVYDSADLTGAAGQLHLRRPDRTVISRAVTIPAETATTGVWSLALTPGDLTMSGKYDVELEITFAGGGVQTFGSAAVSVNPQIA